MLVSYNWLKQYVNLDGVTPEKLAEKVTKGGIEVEGVHVLNKELKKIVIGKVLTCQKHPEADKLNVTTVDIGEEEPVQIVCGAPNVAAGQTVAVARAGARLPGGIKIKKSKLRGQESNGMICALQELGMEDKVVPKEFADGIFAFSEDIAPGSDALALLNLDDAILELGLTPNRADCLNMVGVAYEVGAVLNQKPTFEDITVASANENASDYISVQVESGKDCPYYGAHILKNVKIGPSPLWMQTRLMASGIRPINNVVDITNYVMLEYGQPLHAFDYDRFGTKEVVVRRAHENETITTLDGEERTLGSEHVVITNGKVPVAVAGVMGGQDSEVREDTTTILLESALFDRLLVRTASKDLGLRSESSTRYEKGIDPKRVTKAAKRACQLMEQYAGATVLTGVAEADARDLTEQEITITAEKINRVLGTDISANEMGKIFDRLQFAYQQDNETFTIKVPTRRPDITIKEDIVEEVGRLYGYDNIPKTFPVQEAKPGLLTDYQKLRRNVRRYLEGCGLYQAITYSLSSEKKVRDWKEEKDVHHPIRLAMPMSEEHSTLRLSLIPHLLDAIHYNLSRQMDDLCFYEIGSVFLTEEERVTKLPKEEEHLAAAFTGVYQANLWQGEKKVVDFYVVKGILEGLFAELGVDDRIAFVPAQKVGMHPGRTACIILDGEEVGFVGAVHPKRAKELDIKETYVFELNLDNLLNAEVEPVNYNMLPRFPSITRDIAVVVDHALNAGLLQQTIREAGGKLLKDVQLFDVYEGDKIEHGKKSLAFSLTFYDPERTLTDEEVTNAYDKVLATLNQTFGATLRQ